MKVKKCTLVISLVQRCKITCSVLDHPLLVSCQDSDIFPPNKTIILINYYCQHLYETDADDTATTSATKTGAQLPPTPQYNLAILEDIAVLTQHKILAKTVTTSSGLRNALVLFKVILYLMC